MRSDSLPSFSQPEPEPQQAAADDEEEREGGDWGDLLFILLKGQSTNSTLNWAAGAGSAGGDPSFFPTLSLAGGAQRDTVREKESFFPRFGRQRRGRETQSLLATHPLLLLDYCWTACCSLALAGDTSPHTQEEQQPVHQPPHPPALPSSSPFITLCVCLSTAPGKEIKVGCSQDRYGHLVLLDDDDNY